MGKCMNAIGMIIIIFSKKNCLSQPAVWQGRFYPRFGPKGASGAGTAVGRGRLRLCISGLGLGFSRPCIEMWGLAKPPGGVQHALLTAPKGRKHSSPWLGGPAAKLAGDGRQGENQSLRDPRQARGGRPQGTRARTGGLLLSARVKNEDKCLWRPPRGRWCRGGFSKWGGLLRGGR